MQYAYPFTDEEIEAINALPLEVRLLADQYPKVFENYACDWQAPLVAPGTMVDHVEVYYGAEGTDGPELCWMDGKLQAESIDEAQDKNIVQCMGLGGWLFIAIHGHVLLNRWLDAVLPMALDIALDPQIKALEVEYL